MMNSGVYTIQCVPTHKLYVGSSARLAKRFREHRVALCNNRHKNPHLQSAWNKYGQNAFIFSPILFCHSDRLLVHEQGAIDFLHPSFNIALVAGSPMRGRSLSAEAKRKVGASSLGNKHALGYKHTPEAVEKIRLSALKNSINNKSGWKHSASAKFKISQASLGNKFAKGYKHSPEDILKIKEASLRRWRNVKAANGKAFEQV